MCFVIETIKITGFFEIAIIQVLKIVQKPYQLIYRPIFYIIGNKIMRELINRRSESIEYSKTLDLKTGS